MKNTSKSFKQSLIAIALGTLSMSSISVVASEPEVRQVMVKIEKNNNMDSMVDLKVNGVNEVFSLPELDIGETKTIITESGNELTVTKSEQGLSLMIDGKEIALPGSGGNLAAHIQRVMPLHQNVQDSIQISGVSLDDNQKQIIKNAFISAGIDKKVTFSNHKFVMFSTDGDHDIDVKKVFVKKGEENLKWVSENNAEFEMIVKSDDNSDSEVQIHTIRIEETDEN